jgi:archaellum component FlaC
MLPFPVLIAESANFSLIVVLKRGGFKYPKSSLDRVPGAVYYWSRKTFTRRSIMDTPSAFLALLRELGTPAITIIGFAWMLFQLKKLETRVSLDIAGIKTDMAKLETKVSSDMAKLEIKVSSDMAKLETRVSSDIAKLSTEVSGLRSEVSGLRSDVKSIKGNHLPHIEAAIKELSKGTPNEDHVKAILDLSREVEQRTSDSEQVTGAII